MSKWHKPLAERAWSRVDQSSGPDACWPWTGATDAHGYGRIRNDHRYLAAHRVIYELAVGPIPDGLVIDHLCRVHLCCNPAHLDPVTNEENIARGLASPTKTHCVHDHEFTEQNTRRSSDNRRHCRACEARRSREYQARRRSA